MVKGLSHPKIMDIARLAITMNVIHSSRGQRRTDSPNKSSTGALSLPSRGINSHPARYRTRPTPPLSANKTHPTRTSSGSTLQCWATPPQRPASFASVALRRIVQIELMRSILPSGLPSNYQGPPPIAPGCSGDHGTVPAVATSKSSWLREKSGTTLLVVSPDACEGRRS
jgi:hypothetical protein